MVGFLLGLFCVVIGLQAEDPYLIDTINVIIFSEESTDIITESDVRRPSLEGVMRSQHDIILERLMFNDAKKFKILPDEEAVDRHLQAVQRENNLTLDQLKQVFKAAGYSYEEGKQQFGVMTSVNSVVDFKIRSRLMVPERDVVKYYEEHPEIIERGFWIQKAFVPYAPLVTADEQERSLREAIANHKGLDQVQWGDKFFIVEQELAEDKKFLTQLACGEIAKPLPVAGGFELYKMIEIRPQQARPLHERYQEISDVLRRPRYEKLLADYRQELFDNASLVYLKKDADAVQKE